MKNFLVFCANSYYADGGWNDFKGSFSSIDEAIASCEQMIKEEGFDWGQVVEIGDDYTVWKFGTNDWDLR